MPRVTNSSPRIILFLENSKFDKSDTDKKFVSITICLFSEYYYFNICSS